MPRLTIREFIKRHELLRMLWLDDITQRLFAILPVHQQWELHDFYRPADALLADELTAHFDVVRQARPHLSVLAGRHYSVVRDAHLASLQPDTESRTAAGYGAIEVRFLARPHIDGERLAAARTLAAASVDEDALE